MSTFGEFRMRIAQAPIGAGVHPDVLTGFINDRYQQILQHRSWTRLTVNTILQTAAKCEAGTVAIDAGGTQLTLTGGTWTSAMTGRRIRIAERPEFYTFTFTGAQTGEVDRAYEGEDTAAAGYRIWQAIYTLPAEVGVVESLKVPNVSRDLDQVSQEHLDFLAPSRPSYGRPEMYAPYDDASNGAPQIELYPGPENNEGLGFRYKKKIARFTDDDTEVALLDWVSEAALRAGVEADLYGLAEHVGMKQARELDFANNLADMRRQDNERIAPEAMRMNDRWVVHRAERAAGDLQIASKRARMP